MSTCASLIPSSYATSSWSGAWTPIRYQVETDKWPTNTVDTLDGFNTVVDTFGYAQIELVGTYETYLLGEFIQITGSSIDAYNGVWRVREVVDGNSIVISAPYAGTASGTMQRYYNNFLFQARVYVGIPSGHPYEAERPISLKTESLVGKANDLNIATIDISDFVRADLGVIENALCEIIETGEWIGNDWNLWTAYNCEFREVYDGVDSDGNLVTIYGDWDALGSGTYYAINGAKQFQSVQGINFGDYSMEPNVFEVPANFLTTFDEPTYFLGEEYDIAIISPETDADRYGILHSVNVLEYDQNGTLLATNVYDLPLLGEGVYRFALSELTFDVNTSRIDMFVQRFNSPSTVRLTETKTINVVQAACRDFMYLRWISPLGGWEAWRFDGYVLKGINTDEVVEIRRDVWRDYDTTFAVGATIDDRIKRGGKETRVVHTSHLNDDQANALKWLRMSIKVQEVYFTDAGGCDGYKRRTWLPENAQFIYLDPFDKVKQFRLELTDTAPLFIQGQ